MAAAWAVLAVQTPGNSSKVSSFTVSQKPGLRSFYAVLLLNFTWTAPCETWWQHARLLLFRPQTVLCIFSYTHIYSYTYAYTYMYICVYTCIHTHGRHVRFRSLLIFQKSALLVEYRALLKFKNSKSEIQASNSSILKRLTIFISTMGWPRLVGSLKLQVFFAKEPSERDHILQQKPTFLRRLLTEATPY